MSKVDAAMARQIPRRSRLGVRCEIAGRAYDGRPDVLGHPDHNHIPFDELAEMNACVETGGDEIDSGFVARHVQHDVGVIARELSQLGSEYRGRGPKLG